MLSSNNIAILPHVSADGDSIGSGSALALALKRIGKKAQVILEEKVPISFAFLPGNELLKVYDKEQEEYDCVIAIDTGDLNRLGERFTIFNVAKSKINVDHHITNTMFGDLNYVDIKASSVAEIIWDMLQSINFEVDEEIGTCLYTSIMTDTGGFRYSNTTSKTHEIAGKLIDIGVNISKVSQEIFESSSLARLKILGEVLKTLDVYFDGKVACLYLTDKMLESTGSTEDDAEGMVNYARGIRGVEVGVMLREKNGQIKVSLRSKEYVDVANITASLGGGGHKRAAGCTLQGDIFEIKQKMLDILEKEVACC